MHRCPVPAIAAEDPESGREANVEVVVNSVTLDRRTVLEAHFWCLAPRELIDASDDATPFVCALLVAVE